MYSIIKGRKIRTGLLGTGSISRKHLNAIKVLNNEFELVAVCDSDPNALNNLELRDTISLYTNYEKMIKEQDLDLISICTPSGLHSKQTILAAENNINVITEKPMATSWEDGKKMVKICEKFGVRLFVVKQNRFNEAIKILKRTIDEGRFGRIFLINVNVFWTRPQTYYDSANWRGTRHLDGGALMNQASHYVDLLYWLVGPVDRVQAITSTTRRIQVEDTGVVNIKYQNGALGSLNFTMLTYPQNFEGSITILGEFGTVKIGGQALDKIEEWVFKDKFDHDIRQLDDDKMDFSRKHGHIAYYENVLGVLRGKSNPLTDGKEGLKSLEILIATYLSAESGRSIKLPLDH